MVSAFKRSLSVGRRSLTSPRFSSAVSHHRKWWSSASPSDLALIFALASAFFLSGLYIFHTYSASAAVDVVEVGEPSIDADPVEIGSCDVFDGSWTSSNRRLPIYNGSECPFAERGFDCVANGRRDTDYLSYTWKPRRCEVPPFEARAVLERLRGKRVTFVGDSMGRTQWESLVCMLMAGVEDKSTVREIYGNSISKTIRFLGVKFGSVDLRVDFYRSVFLVRQGRSPRHGPRRVKSTLRLDRMDEISGNWADSDVIVFNSGHWWTPGKLFDASEISFSDRGCYFQVGGALKLGMPIPTAFREALDTWASWVERTINFNRTRVFFRSFEPSHWGDVDQKGCEVTRHPMPEPKGNIHAELSDVISVVVGKMRAPVTLLNVTLMGAFRGDAHIGTWSYPPSVLDCSHWCLPGVPDSWNELIFSYLLMNSS
ncbi:hypothetical protein QJS04_geneDACA009027 [Acorus gramineus]|uniref:Trichome birefringence-like N-terminal domain-containing protein n=1 Tax=Acorus gramineus TaxID=55184 RepID=A0AAV9ARZ3_ACOGR|nr:hypothetical protein QJS04_geneDACA009027 [Acorus gramineus]